MASHHLPDNDDELLTALRSLLAVAHDHQAELELSDTQVASLSAAVDDLHGKLQDHHVKHAAAKAATAAKDESVRCGRLAGRAMVHAFKAAPGATEELLVRAGIGVADTVRTRPTAHTPTELVVTPSLDGVNALRWKHNGNTRGTTYLVEARATGAEAFELLALTTRASFLHRDQRLGAQVSYRVKAVHGDQVSAYSEVVTVWEE